MKTKEYWSLSNVNKLIQTSGLCSRSLPLRRFDNLKLEFEGNNGTYYKVYFDKSTQSGIVRAIKCDETWFTFICEGKQCDLKYKLFKFMLKEFSFVCETIPYNVRSDELFNEMGYSFDWIKASNHPSDEHLSFYQYYSEDWDITLCATTSCYLTFTGLNTIIIYPQKVTLCDYEPRTDIPYVVVESLNKVVPKEYLCEY